MEYKNHCDVQRRIDYLYKNWKGQIPIEQVFDIFGDAQLWYPIQGFNGYEISNHGNVRSMKNFKKYQFGTLCRHRNNVYELSNNNNERIRIHVEELWKLAVEYMKTFRVSYPIGTCVTNIGSRNKRMFIDFEKVSKPKKYRTRKPIPIRKEETFFPKFTVKEEKQITCPIYFEK